MNRLWVRFSLVIIGVVLFMAVGPFILRGIATRLGIVPELSLAPLIPEIMEALPPETLRQLLDIIQANFISNLIFFVVAGSLVTILTGVWLSRTLAAPLGDLESGVRAIEAQEFSYRVPVQGSQELKTVAQAFNQMAAQLEQAESLRRNLLADVAHELRHPLHILQGNLQAILDDVYPLDKAEIGRLLDQTRHLTTLVSDLHELAQADAHQLPIHKQPIDMAELVKGTAETFQPTAKAKKVHLRVALLGTMPQMTVDRSRIRQALHNLLNNALQYTPPGGNILVEVEQQETKLVITVADDGAGIDPEQLPHILDRFYRTDSARSLEERPSGSGTGLGLAIAKAIVEAHEGQITAESDGVGLGSRFIILLPVG
jgi:signal transduction histidine kinase